MSTDKAAREREEKALLDQALTTAMFNTGDGAGGKADPDVLMRRIRLLASKYITTKRDLMVRHAQYGAAYPR